MGDEQVTERDLQLLGSRFARAATDGRLRHRWRSRAVCRKAGA